MTDPTRIKEAGSDVPEELRELFRSASKPESLPVAAHGALSSRIAQIAATPTPLVARWLPWLLGGAVILAGAGAYRTLRSEPTRAASKPLVAAPTAPIFSAVPVEAPALPASLPTERPSHVSAPASAPAPSAAEDALAGEARLLNGAHQAIGSDPKKALTIAQEHARRYPRGQLAAERELILVQALVKLGRTREAEARGRDLRKAAPNSIYEERLDKILPGK